MTAPIFSPACGHESVVTLEAVPLRNLSSPAAAGPALPINDSSASFDTLEEIEQLATDVTVSLSAFDVYVTRDSCAGFCAELKRI